MFPWLTAVAHHAGHKPRPDAARLASKPADGRVDVPTHSYRTGEPWPTPGHVMTVLLFIGLGLVASLMPAHNDTWWHLRAGEHTWQTGEFPLTDHFTHTVNGRYWPNHEWLTQLVFYGLYRIGGMPMLTAFCVGVALAAWILIFNLTRGSLHTRLILVGCAAAFSAPALSLRPHLISLAFFAATLWVLLRRRFLWALPLLFVVWANFHGGVAAGGLLVAGAVGVAALVERESLPKFASIALLCLLATAVTPLGPSIWWEIPVSMERMKPYGISEWRQPRLDNPADVRLWASIAGVATIVVLKRRAMRRWKAVMLVVASVLTLLLALRGVRSVALWAFTTAPMIAALLDQADAPLTRPRQHGRYERRRIAFLAMCVAAAIVTIAFSWSLPLARLNWSPLSDEAVAALTTCEGPLYNRYDEGGYIIWFVKDRKVFMDSRQDPFPQEMVLDQLRLEATGEYLPTFQRHGIRCAFTPDGSPLSRRLAEDNWHAHAAGSGWKVFSAPAGIY